MTLEFFERTNRNLLKIPTSANVSELKASFLIADHIAEAKKKKTLTIGEKLILLAVKDICTKLFREEAAKKVAKRINEVAEDVKVQ